jgi:hypothetical protein
MLVEKNRAGCHAHADVGMFRMAVVDAHAHEDVGMAPEFSRDAR